jgi:hypothetical protein
VKSAAQGMFMAWERRKTTTRRYYYRHARNYMGRPIKLYVGVGNAAHRLAEADVAARLERARARQAWLQQWAQVEQAQQVLDEFCEMMGLLTKGVLVASNWHQHGYEWRRRMLTWPANRKFGSPPRPT